DQYGGGGRAGAGREILVRLQSRARQHRRVLGRSVERKAHPAGPHAERRESPAPFRHRPQRKIPAGGESEFRLAGAVQVRRRYRRSHADWRDGAGAVADVRALRFAVPVTADDVMRDAMAGAGDAVPWELPDDKLLAQCRFEAFVGSGPGGQKRHKTNAAVRYTHLPTKIHAVSTDSRSQRENRIHALRELRHKLAMAIRREIDLTDYHPPAWFAQYPGLHINPKNPLYPSAVAEVLDVLKAA